MTGFSGIYCICQATALRVLKTETFMVVYTFMDHGGWYGEGVLHVWEEI